MAFLICSNLDAYVFAKIKQKFLKRENKFKLDTSLNQYIWLRSSIPDIMDLTLDSIIFVTLTFYGAHGNNATHSREVSGAESDKKKRS